MKLADLFETLSDSDSEQERCPMCRRMKVIKWGNRYCDQCQARDSSLHGVRKKNKKPTTLPSTQPTFRVSSGGLPGLGKRR